MTEFVRVWTILMARGWVAVTVKVEAPSYDKNHTPANIIAIGKVLVRLGRALDQIKAGAETHTTFEKPGKSE